MLTIGPASGFYADWHFTEHLDLNGDGICPAPAVYTGATCHLYHQTCTTELTDLQTAVSQSDPLAYSSRAWRSTLTVPRA